MKTKYYLSEQLSDDPEGNMVCLCEDCANDNSEFITWHGDPADYEEAECELCLGNRDMLDAYLETVTEEPVQEYFDTLFFEGSQYNVHVYEDDDMNWWVKIKQGFTTYVDYTLLSHHDGEEI